MGYCQTPQTVWEQTIGHRFVISTGASSYADQIGGVITLDTVVIGLGQGKINDSTGMGGGDRLFLCSYGMASGLKLREKVLRINILAQYLIIPITDTSFAVVAEHSSGSFPSGYQDGGLSLRLYNLRFEELWRWSYYEGTGYRANPVLLKLRPSASPGSEPDKIHLSVYGYDTTLQQVGYTLFTFRPDGLLESRRHPTSLSGNQELLFEGSMMHPLKYNAWLSVKWSNGTKKAAAVRLDSAFTITKEDTFSRRFDLFEGNLSVLPSPDGGFSAIYSSSGIPVSGFGTDSGAVRLERHDGQGNILWQQTLPRNYYYPANLKGLADGGLLWIRTVSKREDLDSTRYYFERRDKDFNIVWQVELPSIAMAGGAGRYFYRDIAFDGIGGGFAAGSMSPFGNSGDSFGYITRITNLGLPYDPLEAKPSIVSVRGQFAAYPNPTTSVIHIQGMPNKLAQLYSVQGVLVYTIKLDGQGKGEVDVSSLPRGMYLLRSEEKTIRIIKE